MNSLKHIFAACLLFTYQEMANAESFEVVAIEYPPFTTITEQAGGIAFELLENRQAAKNLALKPLFLPPARAARYLRENEWCSTFYPPPENDDFIKYQLSEKNVHVGLLRLKQTDDFTWTSLSQLKGQSAAILRTSVDSEFTQRFTDAGIEVTFAESPQAIIIMVLLSRVDFGLADSWSFERLESESKAKLQFSKTSLIELPVTLYVHNRCVDRISTDETNTFAFEN